MQISGNNFEILKIFIKFLVITKLKILYMQPIKNFAVAHCVIADDKIVCNIKSPHLLLIVTKSQTMQIRNEI